MTRLHDDCVLRLLGRLQRIHTDEKVLSSHDLSPAPHQMPKPHPLPSFETVAAEHRQEPEDTINNQISPAPEIAEPDVTIVDFPTEEEDEVEEEEVMERNDEVQPEEKEHEEDDYSYVSEEEAALKCEQRFGGPMVLTKLLIFFFLWMCYFLTLP